jgi:thiosulfate reductase cytochrome b subunit
VVVDATVIESPASSRPRHSALVRVTHWLTAASFIALVVSGIAILLAHPRLYWGETGALGTPSLIDLPLPFLLTGQSGWGRYLHFLSAWIAVLTGAAYIVGGVKACHFKSDLFRPARPAKYNVVQRITYSAVVFVLFPLMIWTGLAMSPAVTSVVPILVISLGGQQSARTIHFVVANLLLLFVVGHIVMVTFAGFARHVGAMIVGGEPSARQVQA